MLNDLKETINVDDNYSREDQIEKVMMNKDIYDFVVKNDLTHKAVDDGLGIFMNYIEDMKVNEDGSKESRQFPGYRIELGCSFGRVTSKYVKINKDEGIYLKTKSFGMQKELLNASFENFSITTAQRRIAYDYAKRFIDNFGTEKQMKGMYISGKDFKSGKTYLASAIANEIAKRGYSVASVFCPALPLIVKNYGESSLPSLINELKSCDLLILDDFGGGVLYENIRDEVLGIVLDYRMHKNKATFFTSSFGVQCLVDQVLRKSGSLAESIKADKIIERINELSKEFFLLDRFTEIKEY